MITGESRPVDKNSADRVIAGTVNEAGLLRGRGDGSRRAHHVGGHHAVGKEVQQSRSRAQALAHHTASWLKIVTVVAGAVTLVGWLAAGADDTFAVERLVMLVVACPRGLGLAIPRVVAIFDDPGVPGTASWSGPAVLKRPGY